MAPVEFSPLQKTPAGALKAEWKAIPTASGYFAAAMGHDQDSGESIFWTSSEVREPGFALQDYLTPGDVTRFIKEKVILPPAKTTCAIPPIFKEGQASVLQFIAYGEELNLAHPPKPKDPKKRWDIEWSAKVRLKSTAMMPLMATDGDDSSQQGAITRKSKKTAEPAEGQNEESGAGAPAKDIGNKLRGIFGF